MAFRCADFFEVTPDFTSLVFDFADCGPHDPVGTRVLVRRSGVRADVPYLLEYPVQSREESQLTIRFDDQIRALADGWYDFDLFNGAAKCRTVRGYVGARCRRASVAVVEAPGVAVCGDCPDMAGPFGATVPIPP